MSDAIPTLTIDFDVPCKECGKGGATPCGLCLACATKAMSGKPMKSATGKAMQENWKKRRVKP